MTKKLAAVITREELALIYASVSTMIVLFNENILPLTDDQKKEVEMLGTIREKLTAFAKLTTKEDSTLVAKEEKKDDKANLV